MGFWKRIADVLDVIAPNATAEHRRKPAGLLGKIVARRMAEVNEDRIEWTISLMHIKPGDKVLEIGFGPGTSIKKLARLASKGFVAGVDFSETMVEEARKLNAAEIASGKVELRAGSAEELPYANNCFDKAVAVNVIYFLQLPLEALKEMRRVLKPRGLLAICFTSKEDMKKRKSTSAGVFRLYAASEVKSLLGKAGFRKVSVKEKLFGSIKVFCALALK